MGAICKSCGQTVTGPHNCPGMFKSNPTAEHSSTVNDGSPVIIPSMGYKEKSDSNSHTGIRRVGNEIMVTHTLDIPKDGTFWLNEMNRENLLDPEIAGDSKWDFVSQFAHLTSTKIMFHIKYKTETPNNSIGDREVRTSNKILTAINKLGETLEGLGVIGQVYVIGPDMHRKIVKDNTIHIMMGTDNLKVTVAHDVKFNEDAYEDLGPLTTKEQPKEYNVERMYESFDLPPGGKYDTIYQVCAGKHINKDNPIRVHLHGKDKFADIKDASYLAVDVIGMMVTIQWSDDRWHITYSTERYDERDKVRP